MLLPSEIESKSLIPVVRAIMAKKLSGEYYLKEGDIAKLLGVTQAAISNYVRGQLNTIKYWVTEYYIGRGRRPRPNISFLDILSP